MENVERVMSEKGLSPLEATRKSMEAIAGRIMGAMAPYKDALIFSFYPPPIIALGNASGFDFQLIDQTGLGHEQLMAARNQLLGAASQNPKLVGVRPNGLNDVPQYQLDVDMEKARALGVCISEINLYKVLGGGLAIEE